MGYTIHWQQLYFTDFTYNNVIKLIPKVIQSNYSSIHEWGFVIGDSIDSSSFIERNPTQCTFTKTNRYPYTKDFMKALILMVEFGAAISLNHDDTSMKMFLEALDELHVLHPLVSYEEQKAYFMDLQQQ
jgi:GTP-sensing pleiotropic transcriptional regulator CodY